MHFTMASSIIIKTKCLEIARLATMLGLFQVFSLLPSAFAQHYSYNSHVCEKYCFASCNYFSGPEFNLCVNANINCYCTRKFSLKNPFTIVVIVALVLFGISLIACCYTFSRKSKAPSQNRVITSPIVSNVNTVHQSSQTNSHRGIAAPVLSNGNSNSKYDVPPEYCAPPPYNECIISMDQEKY